MRFSWLTACETSTINERETEPLMGDQVSITTTNFADDSNLLPYSCSDQHYSSRLPYTATRSSTRRIYENMISNVASRPDGTNEILSFPSDTIKTESSQVSFTAKKEITENVVVSFNYLDSFLQVEPNSITLTFSKSDATMTITGLEVQSLLYVDIAMCSFNGTDPCTPQQTDSFLTVKVIHSNFINYRMNTFNCLEHLILSPNLP
uniref:Exosporium protein D n=1 Tax=Rhabditophanes sp. KR3021 TaxID=114890 RepID=A0AC35U171_9BILA